MGIAQGERLLQLVVLIGRRKLAKILFGKVAVAVIHLRGYCVRARQLHGHGAIFTIRLAVRAVVAKDVVAADIVAGRFETNRQIVIFGE